MTLFLHISIKFLIQIFFYNLRNSANGFLNKGYKDVYKITNCVYLRPISCVNICCAKYYIKLLGQTVSLVASRHLYHFSYDRHGLLYISVYFFI